jgi:hypothetical protein
MFICINMFQVIVTKLANIEYWHQVGPYRILTSTWPILNIDTKLANIEYWHQVGGWITQPECKCQTMLSYTSWIKGGDSTPLFWLFCKCERSLAEKVYSQPLSTERKGGEASAPLVLFFVCFWVQLGGRASLLVITNKGGAFLPCFFLVFFSIYGCN